PGVPNAILVFFGMALLGWFILTKTIIGRYTFAIGSNEEATALSGVNVTKWKIIIYSVAGIFTGVAGVVLSSRLNSAQPALGMGYELEAIAAVVIGGTSLQGGKGSIIGTVIGALIMGTLINGLRIMSIPQEWQQVAVGAVILVAVYLDILRRRRSCPPPDRTHPEEIDMKKRMTTLATMAVATLALAACGGGTVEDPGIEEPADGGDTGAETETAEGGEADGDISIAIVSKGFQHQFWQAVQQGADEAAAELGVSITFEGPDDESQVDQQIQMLQTALDRGPDAIAFAALDSQAAEPLLQRADDSGIPIIAFDSGVDSDIPLTTVATDNYAAGSAAAEHMSEL